MALTLPPRYWEILHDQLHEACWSLGFLSYINLEEKTTMWVVDGHRGPEHLATEGKTLSEAFWKFNSLAADNRN